MPKKTRCAEVMEVIFLAGPSSGKLFVNDQILSVNGIDVGDADKEKVVDLIRKSNTQLTLIVSQVPSSQVSVSLRFSV